MITLLEFTERVLALYEAELREVYVGLCVATARASYGYYQEHAEYPVDAATGSFLETLLDRRIFQLAPAFGGRQDGGHYWPVQDSESRVAVLNHIINELKEQA